MTRLATFLLLLVAGVAACGEAALRVTGIYSNFHYSEESGDLTGWEILVTPGAAESYNAIIQLAEGSAPMIITGTLLANGTRVVLTVPAGQLLAGKYNGTISATELKLETPAGPETLRRGKSYWQ